MNYQPNRTELHRIVFSGLAQSQVDKAVVAFMALPPADRTAFVASINKILDGRAALCIVDAASK